MTIKTLGCLSIEDALDATSRQGSHELRKRIHKIANQKFGEGAVLLKLQAILERAQRLTQQRNQMIHSLWGRDLDDDIPVVRKDDHSWETAPSSEDINNLSSKIEKITKELNMARQEGFIFEALNREGQIEANAHRDAAPGS
jgi:hypothetical protein